MEEALNKIKEVLESEAMLSIVNNEEASKLSKKNNSVEKRALDDRFEQITQVVESFKNKDDSFYERLVQLISDYIDKLYDREIDFCKVNIANEDIDESYLETIFFNSGDSFVLKKANKKLSEKLFNYVCGILENNKDIKLSLDTLKKLFNRKPTRLSYSIEDDYLYRTLNFERLSEILRENGTLKKSNISIDEVYQLLLDTCELNNEEVFKNLVSSEQYSENHEKIDEVLGWCNASVFIEITKIIRKNYDKDFDRLSVAKERNKNKFIELLIIELLKWYTSEDDYLLIHSLLTDSSLDIDYNFQISDYVGETDLKSAIALSDNKTIINDLINAGQVQDYYSHGDSGVWLYELYATMGEYEKAYSKFEEKYDFKYDVDDEDDTWDKSGYAYGSYSYKDSLASFISKMCSSFKMNGTDYSTIISLINRILNSKNVKYINIVETLKPIKEVLSAEDFSQVLESLIGKYYSGELNFIHVEDYKSMFSKYVIRISKKDEVESAFTELMEKEKVKIFDLPKDDPDNK